MRKPIKRLLEFRASGELTFGLDLALDDLDPLGTILTGDCEEYR